MAPKSKNKMPASTPSTGASSGGASGQKSSSKSHTFVNFEYQQIQELTNNFDSEIRCGQGKYASVYHSEWNSNDVAIKVYEPKNKDYAENEFEALKALRSYRNIVPLIGTCFGKKYAFVMKYVPRSLKEVVDPSKQRTRAIELQWPEVLHIVNQLANGIKAIISENYVIGDITPDNILVDADYNVFICDFGSARIGGVDLPTKNLLYSAKEVTYKSCDNYS